MPERDGGASGAVAVRDAVLADADELARVHVETWQAAYRGIFSDDVLDGLSVADRADRWREILLLAGSDGAWATARVLVATMDGRICGFASWQSSGTVAELRSCYVHPDAWRAGVGSALIEEAHRVFRRTGCATAELWVLEANPRARRFYETHGWEHTGETHLEDRFDASNPVTEARYRIQLGDGETVHSPGDDVAIH